MKFFEQTVREAGRTVFGMEINNACVQITPVLSHEDLISHITSLNQEVLTNVEMENNFALSNRINTLLTKFDDGEITEDELNEAMDRAKLDPKPPPINVNQVVPSDTLAGAWSTICPGEIFIVVPPGTCTEQLTNDNSRLFVSFAHEMAHLYLIGGFSSESPLSQLPLRVGALYTRKRRMPPWFGKGLETWFEKFAPFYLICEPNGMPKMGDMEAITHLVTQFLVHEVANEQRDVGTRNSLLESLQLTNETLKKSNYLAIIDETNTKTGGGLDRILAEPSRRQRIGKSIFTELNKAFSIENRAPNGFYVTVFIDFLTKQILIEQRE
jgi:hypothetical protein